MRTITFKDFVIEELNRMLAEEGRELCLSTERPRPMLASDGGRVIDLSEVRKERAWHEEA
jgi:hypothetical protein